MMKKRNYLLGALLGLCLLGALPFGSQAAELSREDPVRAVTYAGREWVINFWSTETEYMEEDFARIREDGFNAIILCVPWREFQPSVLISAFNEDAFAKLRTVCETAERQGLSVMLRLGYSWDYYDHSNVLERFEGLIYDDTYLEAWKRYASRWEKIPAWYSHRTAPCFSLSSRRGRAWNGRISINLNLSMPGCFSFPSGVHRPNWRICSTCNRGAYRKPRDEERFPCRGVYISAIFSMYAWTGCASESRPCT